MIDATMLLEFQLLAHDVPNIKKKTSTGEDLAGYSNFITTSKQEG